jgi:hypothetical protein
VEANATFAPTDIADLSPYGRIAPALRCQRREALRLAPRRLLCQQR